MLTANPLTAKLTKAWYHDSSSGGGVLAIDSSGVATHTEQIMPIDSRIKKDTNYSPKKSINRKQEKIE
jgi:hypothetical protein